MTMTTTVPPTIEATTPRWRGINHLALITPDMDVTVRFFEFGSQCTVAFFEYFGVTIEPLAKAAGVPDPRAVQFDHLALNLPDEDALLQLQQRLRSGDCEVTDIIDHGGVRSVYFSDPNGIALEASWWVHDSTGRRADYDDARTFADPNPVPALQELAATGTLATVPSTRLA